MDRTEDVRKMEKRRLEAANFISNNGRVLRTINLLRCKFVKLKGLQRTLEEEGISESEFLDAINFLSVEGYIELRKIGTYEMATIEAIDYICLESKLTGKAIRLLAGGIDDNMIEV